LTREDFFSEVEFRRWQTWFDEDYHNQDDACFLLDQGWDSTELSPEDELTAALDKISIETIRHKTVAIQVSVIKNILTKTQYRRLLCNALMVIS